MAENGKKQAKMENGKIKEMRLFCELITKFSLHQISCKFDEEHQWCEMYNGKYKYRIQFYNGKFDHADVYKYNIKDEAFDHLNMYEHAYEFIANI